MTTLRIQYLASPWAYMKRLSEDDRWRLQRVIEGCAFAARGDVPSAVLAQDAFIVTYAIRWDERLFLVISISRARTGPPQSSGQESSAGGH